MIITEEGLGKWRLYIDKKRWNKGTVDTYKYYAVWWIGKELNQDNLDKQLVSRGNNYTHFIKCFLDCFGVKLKVTKPKRTKGRKDYVDYFTEEEMDTILGSIRDRRLNLIIRLMYENGLRVSEVMNLQKKNFDMVNKRIRGKGKGDVKFEVPIHQKTYMELEIYIRQYKDEDYVFHWKGIKIQRWKAWNIIKKEVGALLPYKNAEEIYPHAFKHTCGTVLLKKGFNLREIQKILRHKNLETVSHYTAVDDEKLNSKLRGVFK